MAETGIKIDIFRKKTLEDFTAILSDPESRLECGSAAASVAAVFVSPLFARRVPATIAVPVTRTSIIVNTVAKLCFIRHLPPRLIFSPK